MGSFDPKRVPVTDWVVVGAGVLAFIVSFFPWETGKLEQDGQDLFKLAGEDPTKSAWNSGFGAWFSVLLLLVAAGLVAAHFAGGLDLPQVPGGIRMVAAGVAVLAAIVIVLRWITYPSPEDELGVDTLPENVEASISAGWGLIVGLILALVAAVAAYLGTRNPAPVGPPATDPTTPPPPPGA